MLTIEVESFAWTLARDSGAWRLYRGAAEMQATRVRIPADVAWRMFYNAEFDRDAVSVEGDASLAAPLFGVRSVMV